MHSTFIFWALRTSLTVNPKIFIEQVFQFYQALYAFWLSNYQILKFLKLPICAESEDT